MGATFIMTPGGERLAILPADEYERLVEAAEDAADLAAYDRAKHALASGEDELVAPEFAARLIAGEPPVRVWREARGLTRAALAAAAGLPEALLGEIEAGSREAGLATMRRIADSLRISLDDLVAATQEG